MTTTLGPGRGLRRTYLPILTNGNGPEIDFSRTIKGTLEGSDRLLYDKNPRKHKGILLFSETVCDRRNSGNITRSGKGKSLKDS